MIVELGKGRARGKKEDEGQERNERKKGMEGRKKKRKKILKETQSKWESSTEHIKNKAFSIRSLALNF